jgi:hypothetical protein
MVDFLACETVNVNMTSLQGKITTTYDKLVEAFGHPTMTDGDPYEKVNAQWKLEFKVPFTDDTGIEDFDTVLATIYNWKDGYIPTETYEWHIGGFDNEAVDLVQKVLDKVEEVV